MPPSPEAMERYLRVWIAEELHFHPERFPRLDSPGLFGNDRPLEVEIGCGTGEFLLALAAERPGTNFLGIDPLTKVLFFAAREAERLGLKNLRLVRAPMDVLYPLLAPASVSAAYVHFPDPFVRTRGRHKVLNATFFEAMQRALLPGGTLSVVSDKPEIIQEALAALRGVAGLEPTHAEPFLVGFDPPVKSRYQKTWERYAVQPQRFLLRKRG